MKYLFLGGPLDGQKIEVDPWVESKVCFDENAPNCRVEYHKTGYAIRNENIGIRLYASVFIIPGYPSTAVVDPQVTRQVAETAIEALKLIIEGLDS